jgi:hypothetical protein
MPVVIALAVIAFGCGRGPDESKLRTTIHSWIASARLTAEARVAGETPRRFAVRALETAEEELRSAIAQLRERDAAGAEARSAPTIDELPRVVAQLRGALARDDRESARAALDQLRAAGRSFPEPR